LTVAPQTRIPTPSLEVKPVADISKTADHALAVLVELTESAPMTTAELSRSLKLNRTVVHRLLNTLHQRGFVVRQSGGYAPGALLVRMAARVEPELRAAAAVIMRELSEVTGETVVLHIADGPDAVVLDQVVGSRHIVRVEHHIGSRHSLTHGASGRVLLAFLDDDMIDAVLSKTQDPDGVRRQLEGVRRLGYCLSHDELQQGVHGLAMPVLGHADVAVASLAILIPTTRSSGIAEHIAALSDAAVRAGTSLSGSGT
jgi:IclR family KDG regulon transcriptional repressor